MACFCRHRYDVCGHKDFQRAACRSVWPPALRTFLKYGRPGTARRLVYDTSPRPEVRLHLFRKCTVLTGTHVVRDAPELTVMHRGRRAFKRTLLGSDSATRTALLIIIVLSFPIANIDGAKPCRRRVCFLDSIAIRVWQSTFPGIGNAKGRSLLEDGSGRVSRPTLPLIPATRTARCSMRVVASSASVSRFIA